MNNIKYVTVATPPTSVNNLLKVSQKRALAYFYSCYHRPLMYTHQQFVPCLTNDYNDMTLTRTKISIVTLVTYCIPFFGSGANFFLLKSSHSLKFLLFKVPTVQSSHCSKFPQFKVLTVQSFHSSKFLLFKVPTVQSSHCSKFPQFKVPTCSVLWKAQYKRFHSIH
jgi:hypothetical protein